MKCKNTDCQNEVPRRLERTGFVYCQRSCAPYGNLGLSSSTLSVPKRETFYSKAAGIPSPKPASASASPASPPQRSPEERPNAPQVPTQDDTPLRLLNADGSRSASTTRSTGTESTKTLAAADLVGPMSSDDTIQNETGRPENGDPITGGHGMSGMQETEKSTALTRSPDETEGTSPGQSVEPVKNLESERSATMSLIDDSALLLRDCMRTQIKKKGEERPLDFREVNSIANLGKQIAQLAKVKLDAIKEARK